MPLLNLPNPPDGFSFSVNGLGQQTGTLIKSAASTINDAAKKLVSSLPKPDIPAFSAPADSNGPSLTATMDAIKNGSINKDITASLNKISSVASSLPNDISSAVADAQAAIAAKMAAAQAQLPKLMAIAQSNMDLTAKMALANGAPATEAQLKAASGSLAIFQDGPAALKAQAESISKSVAEAGKDFGAKLPAALNTASNYAKAGLDKVVSLATTAGASVTSFANSVPAQTIPDPGNPGQTIPNPAYTSFAANPANASKLASLDSLKTNLTTAAAGLTTAFGAIEAKANAAVAGGIADLKAFAESAQLAQPAGGIMAEARALSIDATKVSAAQINKVIAQSAASNPAAPPKAADAAIKETKVKEAEAPVAIAATTAIFGKNPSDKISETFVDAYATSWGKINDYFKSITAPASLDAQLNAFYPNYTIIRDKAKQIESAKSDPASRTAEETYYVDKRAKLRGLAENFVVYQGVIRTQSQMNERARQYQLLKKLFEENKTYGEAPLSIETAIRTSAVLSDAEEAKYFKTYADLIKAKPELALPANLENPYSA
jgi:hypothetical protein